MEQQTNENGRNPAISKRAMTGRKPIYTDASVIDATNVVNEVVVKAYTTHSANRGEIDYLWKYYKGDQPILYRTKKIRDDIINCVVENRANEIVSFKTGYLVGNPIQYISRNNKGNKSISEAVDALNDMMMSESKATKDKELVDWMHICGTSYRLALPSKDGDSPFSIYTLDPRNAYVIYANTVDHRPLAGVYYTTDEYGQITTYSVYTDREFFVIQGNKIARKEPHALGRVPIIEYPANNARLGAFEVVLPLLDALNTVDSNRIDGIEQFIQSLVVLYNAELPEGEDATTLQEKGLIVLHSAGDNKADIKLMSETLSQADTQTLKQDMNQTILEIVGMPSQGNGSTGDSSNNGAVILKNGWQGAEARAKDSELMFKKSEREFLKLILDIVQNISGIALRAVDVEPHFTRRNYEDINSKANVLNVLLSSGKVAPKLAFEASGLFIDSEEAYQESMAYMQKQEAKAKAIVNAQPKDTDNEEESTDGDTKEEPTAD